MFIRRVCRALVLVAALAWLVSRPGGANTGIIVPMSAAQAYSVFEEWAFGAKSSDAAIAELREFVEGDGADLAGIEAAMKVLVLMDVYSPEPAPGDLLREWATSCGARS